MVMFRRFQKMVPINREQRARRSRQQKVMKPVMQCVLQHKITNLRILTMNKRYVLICRTYVKRKKLLSGKKVTNKIRVTKIQI